VGTVGPGVQPDAPDPLGRAANVVAHEDEAGHGHEDQSRGGHEAETDGDGHRDEELRLEGLLGDEGHQSEHGGDGGEEYGPEALLAGFEQSVEDRHTAAAGGVVEVHEDDGVVDDDPREGDESDEREEGHVVAQQEMPPDHSHDGEGDGDEDDQRLEV